MITEKGPDMTVISYLVPFCATPEANSLLPGQGLFLCASPLLAFGRFSCYTLSVAGKK